MTTLKRAQTEEHAASYLIVCTERLKAYIYETKNFVPVKEVRYMSGLRGS